ncbi:MAG TPA: caspase family protein [Blastocatellia bacterium]|nr:caspase family protein [Blastocatellia bacterium]
MITLKRKLYILTSLCLLLAIASNSSAQATSGQANNGSKTWAVIVGVSRYPKLPGGQQLQFADKDAAAFAEALKATGIGTENIRLLTGAEATLASIKSAMGNWLARSAAETDTVIIFFSGHGMIEREYRESYLLAYDSDAKDPFATSLSLREIRQALDQRVRARRVLIIADAARRDFFDPDVDANAAQVFVESFNEMSAQRAGLSVILASGPGEFSREGQRWGGHGVFLKHLLDGMNQANDRNGDGSITAEELFDFVAARVSDDTSNKQHAWRTAGLLAQIALSKSERRVAAATLPKPESPAKSSAPDSHSSSKVEKTATEKIEPPSPMSDKKSAEQKPTPVAVEKRPDAAENKTATRQMDPKPVAKTKAQASGETTNVKPEATAKPTAPRQTDSTSAKLAPNNERVEMKRESEVAKVEQPAPKPVQAAPKTEPPAPRPLPRPANAAPSSNTLAINAKPPAAGTTGVPASSEAPPANLPEPPLPKVNLPPVATVPSTSDNSQPRPTTVPMPAAAAESSGPSLVMQLEAAIYAKSLLEPKNASAWDLYLRAAADPAAAADVARLKPMLVDALISYGRAIVSGDVRADNIGDRVDDFKRAGQAFARARSLQPSDAATTALEKLSAAQALIALQFYDEAERALGQLQNVKLAAIENSLGLVYQGKLDQFQAERAFKRAIELNRNWAAPHYNLALLYRSQRNPSALDEFERAAQLDPANAAIAAALGDECFTRQQWQRAAEAFRKAIALNPTDDTLHTKLGHALFSQGLQEEANREYQKARELRGKP